MTYRTKKTQFFSLIRQTKSENRYVCVGCYIDESIHEVACVIQSVCVCVCFYSGEKVLFKARMQQRLDYTDEENEKNKKQMRVYLKITKDIIAAKH